MNGLMRAVEREIPSSTRRKPRPLSFGVAVRQCKADVYINMGGTAGFPVPVFRGSFCFIRSFYMAILSKRWRSHHGFSVKQKIFLLNKKSKLEFRVDFCRETFIIYVET